jgi:protein-S-isoprenylcysteine O-methyltransferase Ste14
MAGVLAGLYGIVAYAISLATILYSMGFIANLLVPRSIDVGEPGQLGQALTVDALLIGVFAIQHSVMARRGFKRWWTRVVPASIERSTYVLASSLGLLLLFWQWRPVPDAIWTIDAPLLAMALQALYWLGWGVAFVSTFLIDHFELFGLSQVLARLRNRQLPEPAFKAPLLYRLVRHPLYLGFLLAFWATPAMTVGHLLFAAGMTAYILIAVRLEERDLTRQFGDRYRRYRQEVAMLVPLPKRGKAAGNRAWHELS